MAKTFNGTHFGKMFYMIVKGKCFQDKRPLYQFLKTFFFHFVDVQFDEINSLGNITFPRRNSDGSFLRFPQQSQSSKGAFFL
jgi:hypothetical protein